MIGDRVEYIGTSWMGKGLMEMYPEGAVVIDIREGCPIVRWPSGGVMITGEPDALRVTQTLEEIFAAG